MTLNARRILSIAAAATVITVAGCGTASAATLSGGSHGSTVSPGWYQIEMDISNNSTTPMTLVSASHDYVGSNTGHWQQRPLQILAGQSSETVTAYTNDPSGFEVSLDYQTANGKAVIFQAVNYVGKTDNAGATTSLDPSLTVHTAQISGGMSLDWGYYVNPTSGPLAR